MSTWRPIPNSPWPWEHLPLVARFVGGGSPQQLIAWKHADDETFHLRVIQPS
jgi:hypothetical protein